MDIDDDAVTDPAAEFGELFEGQTVAFENELGGHDDDVLRNIGDGMGLATSSRRSSHPSDQEILGDNLPFVPDDYFQQQQIVVEGETSEVGTKSSSKGKKAPASGPEGKKSKAKQTPKKQQQQKQKQTQNQKQLNGSASTTPGQGQGQSQPIPTTVPVPIKTPTAKGKSPANKKGKSKKATPPKSIPFINIKKEVLDTHIQAPPQRALFPMAVTIKTEPPDYPVAKILPLPAPVETPKPPETEEQKKQKKKVMIVKDVKHFTTELMERYMKRRGFKTKHEKKGPVTATKSVNKGVFALTAANQMTTATSSIRVVSFGTKYEPDLVIGEIEKFWKFYLWIKCKSVAISSELVPMLVPILLHFYFEMLHANLYPFAKRIIMEFSKTFLHEDRTKEHYDLIVALLKINNSEAIKKDTSLKPRLNRKFEFILSEITIIQLRRFLAKLDEPILVNLFTEHFKIRTRESKEFFDSLIWEDMLDSEDSSRRVRLDSDSSSDSESEFSDCEDVFQQGQVDDDVKSEGSSECGTRKRYVDEVIDELRNTVEANLPAISVFTTGNRPISGAISKMGTLMAFGLQDAGIRLYPVEKSRDMCQMSYDSPSSDGVKFIGGHAGSVYGVHFHPRTKLLFSAGQDSFMRVWDLNGEDPACRAVYRGHFGPIWKIDIPESGSLVATAGLDTTARIFVPEKTEFVRVMVGHYFSVNTVKFHPNEAYIATGSADKSVRLWSVNDGNIVRMFTGSMGTISCLAFHESGKYLAGAGEDDKIIIWDLAKGESLASLNCLSNCRDLTFSGYILTACFRNGSLQVFNLRPLLGGDESDAFEQLFSGSVSAPFTTSCFVKTLFKVQYQDPGRLYCLGSDLPVEEDDFIRPEKATSTEPESESMYDVLLATEESLVDDDTATMTSPTSSLPCSPMSCLEPTTPTLLHQVLQSAPGPSTEISTSTTSVADDGGDTMETDPISNVIEGNAPVETMMLQETPPPEVTVGASQPQAAPTTSTPQMISASDLDAAIASVIDQSGCDSSGGSGTITMYASS